MKIEQLVAHHIEKIRSGKMSGREMIALLDNTRNHADITDELREELISAIETALRLQHPATATRLFGPKEVAARELLGEVLEGVSKSFDLSGNRVGSGIKIGGSMISGKHYVDLYCSFKSAEGWHAGFGYNQVTPDSDPYLETKIYFKGENNPDSQREAVQFKIDQIAEATAKFSEFLARAAPRRTPN